MHGRNDIKAFFEKLLLFSLLIFFAAAGGVPLYAEVITIESGWEYRIGDSPRDADQHYIWTASQDSDAAWKTIAQPADVPDRGAHSVVWFRIKLPELSSADQALHCANIDQCFSLFLDGNEFYSFGSEKEYLSSFASHIVPLPHFKNRYLYMRVYSGWERLGMYANKLKIGPQYEIQKNIVSSELKFVILSFFLAAAGICIAFAGFLRIESFHFFSVGMFSLFLGIYAFIRTELKNILFGNNYSMWGTADLLSLYVIPVFINIFLSRLFRCSWRNPFKWITVWSMLYACFACGVAVFHPNYLVPMVLFNFYIIALNAFALILFALYNAVKGDSDARMILVSFIVISLFVGHDVLQEMGLIQMTVFLAPWGQIVSILVLMYIAVREASRSRNELISIEKELDIAQRIQVTIIPDAVPEVKGISIGVQYQPVKSVGGDLYDFHTDDAGGLGILIADVAGHGVPAALIASMVNVAFFTNRPYFTDPALMLEKINSALQEKCEKYFVTALYIYITPDRSTVRFARAGHLPLLVYRRQSGTIESFTPKGRIIGRMQSTGCENYEIPLFSGDRLVMYSDGILENRDSKGEMFGSERFNNVIHRTVMMNSDDSSRCIADEARKWGCNESSEDDIALLVVDIE